MADRRGTARMRAAAPIFAGLLALGVLALAVLACTTTPASTPTQAPTTVPTLLPTVPPTQAPSSAPSPSPSAAATGISAGPACVAADLKASHDLVEGAAGSRLTNVVLVSQRACAVDGTPSLGLRDAHGAELVASSSAASGRIDLEPNVSYSTTVRFANWCNPDPAFPLQLVIRVGGGEVLVTGTSFPDAGDMPPCNGGGGPRLESNLWAQAPA